MYPAAGQLNLSLSFLDLQSELSAEDEEPRKINFPTLLKSFPASDIWKQVALKLLVPLTTFQ